MRTIALKDKKGFSLVEILISLVLLLIVFLALTQTAMVSIDSNMTNILRDEAVSIAEMSMNEARNIPFDNLADSNDTVNRNFRNIANFQYNVSRIITPLGSNNKQIDITVTWDWKNRTVANGNPYSHSISTIMRKP
jgi:prepilin-type N-terminal cleavage/methylation domain-containing protein